MRSCIPFQIQFFTNLLPLININDQNRNQNNEARRYTANYDTQTLAMLVQNPNINPEKFPHNVMELDSMFANFFVDFHAIC